MSSREAYNKYFLLKLLSYTQKTSREKLTCLAFVIQKEARKLNKQSFNYEFLKMNFNLYSEELEKDLEELFNEGFVSQQGGAELSQKGEAFLADGELRWLDKGEREAEEMLKFFGFLHQHTPLFELIDGSFKKYDLAKYPSKMPVMVAENGKPSEMKSANAADSKKEIVRKYQEIERNEANYARRISELLRSKQNKSDAI